MSASLRFCLACLIGSAVALAAPDSNLVAPVFTPEITHLVSPAGPGSFGGSLVKVAGGAVVLSWVEPTRDGGQHALKFASYETPARRWSAPRTIAQGNDWVVSHANLPVLAVQANGRMTAGWCVSNPTAPHPGHHVPAGGGHDHGAGCHALISESKDGGAHWSAPQPLTRESDVVEFVSLQPLADGQVLAVWLDGRAKKSGGKTQRLYSRIIGSDQPDVLVDASVCDCCQTTLTSFPDGSALLAYRGRTGEEVRDILTARFIDGQWEKRRTKSGDDWVIAGCPVNGPRLTRQGPHVMNVWYTGASNAPRVLFSLSSDAGEIYTLSQRADLGRPLGRVDALLLHDGSRLLSWVEGGSNDGSQPAGIYLRRYGATGGTLPPALLAATAKNHAGGFPRMALAKDFDTTPAEVVVVYTQTGEPSRVQTLLVTLPEAAVLAEADSACACTGRAEDWLGYPLRARIVAISAETGTVRVQHGAIPGLMRAGEQAFKASPALVSVLKPDRDILARIEQRDGDWWIFDVRVLLRPKE